MDALLIYEPFIQKLHYKTSEAVALDLLPINGYTALAWYSRKSYDKSQENS
jgi:hypothetical protein